MLTPKEAGVDINVNWNTRIMRDFINQEFGKEISMNGILRMLKRFGFSFTRPTYVLAKADKKNR